MVTDDNEPASRGEAGSSTSLTLQGLPGKHDQMFHIHRFLFFRFCSGENVSSFKSRLMCIFSGNGQCRENKV